MAINFPDSPSVNDLFSAGGTTWKWSGVAWNVVRAPYSLTATSPITNTGTAESPVIGVDQALLGVSTSQVTGLGTYVDNKVTDNNKMSYGSSVSGTTYSLTSSNIYKLTEFTSASAVTVTIPNDPTDSEFPIGSSLELRQMGDGRVQVQVTSPATLASTDSYTKTRTKYSSAMLEKRASNAWILTGDIDA